MSLEKLIFSVQEIANCETLLKKGVYKIVNTQNKKIYVGSTGLNFLKRWRSHLADLRKKEHHCKPLQYSYNKRGEEVYSFEIIEVLNCSKEDLINREQYWLDFLNPKYNLLKVAGSNLGYKYPEDVLQRKRKSFREQKIAKNNKSGTKGVYYREKQRIWTAQIGLSWARVPLGFHRLKENAIKARQEAELKYWSPEFLKLSIEEQKIEIKKDNLKRRVDIFLYPDKDTNTKYAGIYLVDDQNYQVKLKGKVYTPSYKTLEEAIIVRDKRYKELVGYQDEV